MQINSAMKIFTVIGFLLPVLTLILAISSPSALNFNDFSNYSSNEENAFVETNENMDDASNGDLANIQDLFNVVAQVAREDK